MANIKMLRTAMVGAVVRKKGWAGAADDAEAKALVTAGLAMDHKGAVTDAADDKASLASILDGTVADVTERLAGVDKSQLKALGKLEGKGKDRAGVHAAIDAAAAAE